MIPAVRRLPSFVLALMLPLACSRLASGQDFSTEAEQLFRQGIDALGHGNYADACSLLNRSQQLEGAVGTLVKLADCEEETGLYFRAYRHLVEAAALARAKSDRRLSSVNQRLARVDARVPRIVIRVAPDMVDEISLRVDRSSVEPATSLELRLEAGPHLVTASSPGKKRWSQTIDAIAGGPTLIAEVPTLEDEPIVFSTPAPAPLAPSAAVTTMRRDTHVDSGRWIVPAFVGGAGAVFAAVGTLFWLEADSRYASLKTTCSQPGGCSQAVYVSGSSDVRTDEKFAVGGWIAGGALIAGAVLWYVTRTGAASSPVAITADPWARTVDVRGRF